MDECIIIEEREMILKETHAGAAGVHEGARALARKIFQLRIHKHEIYKDVTEVTKRCRECQTFLQHL